MLTKPRAYGGKRLTPTIQKILHLTLDSISMMIMTIYRYLITGMVEHYKNSILIRIYRNGGLLFSRWAHRMFAPFRRLRHHSSRTMMEAVGIQKGLPSMIQTAIGDPSLMEV